jgi:SAM-dependent methyltransferase
VPDPRAVDIVPPAPHSDLGYDEFAWFYDRYWASDALRWELSVLERLVLERLPPGASVLDVCCGSGHLVNTLAERGFSVTGVDLSAAMVELGRRNAPLATFHVADVRDLRPDIIGTFAAAVSMYDSLNHLLSVEDLRAALTTISGCLDEDGWLVFDLNTKVGLEAWGAMSRADDEAAFIVEPHFDPATRRGEFRFVGFRKDGLTWRRVDTRLHQTWFEDEEVHEALVASGFQPLSQFDRAALLGAEPSGKKTVFLARKIPGSATKK